MKPDYSRRRAILLLVVWLLMAAHVVHWKLAGRTLAPLELNEVMHTLELGVVTAGFLFMLLVLGSVLVFGRFFCSWGCHILALEDGSAWLLNRAGIKARPVRSRVLAWVPFGALLYMFVWPQVKRVLEGREAPKLHVLADGEGWASFVTSDFARNLPGPGMALVTFVVVGLVMVYFLGSRSFCRYGCPYGALFALADRMAPGRIVASKSCTACGLCTAACQSGIAVHEELQRFGTVVNSACLRDLDCVSACPDGAVRFGWAAPPVVRFWNRNYWAQRPRVRFHLSPWEEVVALLLFFLGLGISRGLYGLVPFLLSLGIGAMTAWVGVLSLRLVQRPAVKLGNVQLKLNGKLTKGGRRFALGALMAGVCLAHGGFIRWHQFQGEALFEQVTHRASQDVEDPSLDQVRAAASHYEAINDRAWIDYPLAEERWAVMRAMEGALEAQAGRAQMALGAYSAALGAHPDPGGVHLSMGELLAGMDQFPRAIDHLRAAVHYHPTSAAAHYNLAVLVAHGGDTEEGIAHLTKAAKLDPDDAEIQNNLGFLLAGEGHVRQAEEHLQRAIELDSSFAIPYLNLGLLVWAQGRSDEARELLRRGLELAPGAVPMLEKAGYPLENLR